MKMNLHGWGNFPSVETHPDYFETPSQLRQLLKNHGEIIVYGSGRSYSDSALNERVIFSRRFESVLDFDPIQGIVTCESGVTLADLIEAYLPRGWFLQVTPGTKFITVGGAIASDVHGKNHHIAGCFSESVIALELMLPDGGIVRCSREINRELFLATCGGMGLTGVILSAQIKFQPVSSASIEETLIRGRNLEEIFSLFEIHSSAPYSVAWIDCLAKGENTGRSVLMLGEHARRGMLTIPKIRPSISIPVFLPGGCLNRYSIKAFNNLYYITKPPMGKKRLTPLTSFFYPLDAIGNWNRMYGKNGFTQYQLVLPKASSQAGLNTILNRVSDAGLGSFLAVLKRFGPENGNYLSFPMEGYTLAMDFKIEKKLFPLLNELDAIVADHKGRLYLTKDVRMGKRMLAKGYPHLEKFKAMREDFHMNKKFQSLQSKRLGL